MEEKINQSLNDYSALYHGFSHTTFNASKILEQFGEIEEKQTSSRSFLLIIQ